MNEYLRNSDLRLALQNVEEAKRCLEKALFIPSTGRDRLNLKLRAAFNASQFIRNALSHTERAEKSDYGASFFNLRGDL